MSFAAALAAIRAAHPDLESAELFVTDLNGIPRGKLLPAALLDKAGQGGVKLPVSTLGLDVFGQDVAENAIAIEKGDPDGVLVPLPQTLAPMLWAQRPTVQLACMVTEPDGAPCAYDPRAILGAVTDQMRARGYHPVVALELEFYLIDPTLPQPPVNPQAGGRLSRGRTQVFDLTVMRAFEGVLSDISRAALALGAPAETVICEYGAGQFEMNLRHVADPLAAADHMVSLKRAIRGTARAHGMDASFMPKPYGGFTGSGQHIHVSLCDGTGRNLFDSDAGPNALARHALAGLIETMAETLLIYAPHQNSYRRLAPGTYAPIVAAWGLDNRGVALRMPETAGPGARIEHRTAGADANPYLLAAAVLAGMLEGIEAGREPPPPVAAEAGADQGLPLPLSWRLAEQQFAASNFVARRLGPEFRRIYAAMKRQERATLLSRVPDVEYDAYLRVV